MNAGRCCDALLLLLKRLWCELHAAANLVQDVRDLSALAITLWCHMIPGAPRTQKSCSLETLWLERTLSTLIIACTHLGQQVYRLYSCRQHIYVICIALLCSFESRCSFLRCPCTTAVVCFKTLGPLLSLGIFDYPFLDANPKRHKKPQKKRWATLGILSIYLRAIRAHRIGRPCEQNPCSSAALLPTLKTAQLFPIRSILTIAR